MGKFEATNTKIEIVSPNGKEIIQPLSGSIYPEQSIDFGIKLSTNSVLKDTNFDIIITYTNPINNQQINQQFFYSYLTKDGFVRLR